MRIKAILLKIATWNRFHLQPNPENPSVITAPSALQPYPDLIRTEACVSALHSLAWRSPLFLEHTHTHTHMHMYIHCLSHFCPSIFPQSLSIVRNSFLPRLPPPRRAVQLPESRLERAAQCAFHLRTRWKSSGKHVLILAV